MKAQRQTMHMLEGLVSEPSDRVHRHCSEQGVTHLREKRHQRPREPIDEGQHDGNAHHPPVRLSGDDGWRDRIGRPFEGIGNCDGHQLGQHQHQSCPDDPHSEISAIFRPEIGPKTAHRSPHRGFLTRGGGGRGGTTTRHRTRHKKS